MADFLINVRTTWDAAGVRAYANEVRAAIRQIEAAASGVRGPAASPAQVQSRVQAAQAQAEAGLASIGRAGVLEPEQLAGLTAGVRADFERLAQTYGVELAAAERLEGQVARANTASEAASTAQQRADRLREARAEREAVSAERGAAAVARAGAANPERLDRLTDTKLLQQQAARRAQLLDRGLDVELGADREATKRAVAEHDFAETMERRAARARAMAEREAAIGAAELRDRAEALIASGRNRGAVNAVVTGREGGVETLGAAAAQTSGLRSRVSTVESETILASEQELQARVEATRARRRLNEAVNQQVNAEAIAARETQQAARETRRAASEAERLARARAREAAAAERGAQQAALRAQEGTIYQQLQQRVSRRTGQEDRPAVSFPTVGQAATSGLITTARFAASGALLYGALTTIQQMVRDASALERTFNQIRRQFESVDQAAQFPGFRRAVIDLARETGQAVTEVAFVAFQMQGAFQDTTLAIQQTTAAIKLARVTGLELNEVVDSLTAISLAYRDTQTQAPLPIEEIGDIALGIQERFGVLAKETIKATADLAPVARQAGIPYRELATIIGSIQQVSGRSGTAIAEGLGRVIPAIQDASAAIVNLYSRTPAIVGRLPEIARAAGAGETGVILEGLIRDFDKLDQTSQNYVVSLLGGRREAQLLNGIFGNTSRLIKELDRTQGDAGKTNQYFSDLQETLAQRMARLGQVFQDLGQKLFQSGLGDFLKDLVDAGGGVLAMLSGLVSILTRFNQLTGGSAARIAEIVVGLKLLQAVGRIGLIQRVIGGVATALTPAGAGAGAGAQLATAAGSFVAGRAAAGVAAGSAGQTAVGRGVLTGAGVLGLNPYVLAAGSVAIATQRYLTEQGQAQTAINDIGAKLQKLDADNIARLRETGKLKVDFWTKFWIRLPGGPTRTPEEESVRVEAGKRAEPAVRQFQAAVGAKLLDDDEHNNKLIKDALAGRKGAIDEINSILELLGGSPQGRQELLDALGKFNEAQPAKDFAGRVESGDVVASVAAAKESYAAGATSAAEFIEVLQREASGFQEILRQAGKLTDDQAKKYAEVQREISTNQSAWARGLADYAISVQQLGGEGPQAEIDTLLGLLRNPTFTDPKERQKAATDLVAAEKALLAEQVATTDDVATQLAILREGISIPDEARVALVQAAVDQYGAEFQAFLRTATGSMDAANAASKEIVRLAVEGNLTLQAAARAWIQDQIRFIGSQLPRLLVGLVSGQTDAKAFQDQIARLTQLRTSLDSAIPEGPPVAGETVSGSATEIASKARELERKQETDAKDAHRQAEETARARLALRKAQLAGDPVGQAEVAIEEAHHLADIAETEAEALNAQAQLVTAQQQLAQAQLQVGDAYRNIDKAMAQAAGDTVRVAQLELEQARAHLQSARERGDVLGQTSAEAERIAAEAGVVAARLQEGKDNIEFMAAMGQVTTQQEIAYYEALKTIPGLNKKQIDEITLKIHQLRQELSRDVQFNIPSEVQLPTLYEVRRANQLASVGAGYQDNRQVSNQFYINNLADGQAVAEQLSDAFTGPSRYGTVPRKY